MSLNKSKFRKLIELGKKKGFLTYDEIDDALPHEGFSVNDMDNLLEMLGEMGIDVVESDEKARVNEKPPEENLSTPYKKGDFIGRDYEVYDILGMGGFGIVYLVYDHEFKSVCALKTFREKYLWDREAQERFKKEAKIWIDLERHPYLVRAYLVEEISGRLFIVIEYIPPNEDGLNSLEGYLRHKPPDLEQSLRWAIQFCYGMEYAYSKGIRAHRDIKPANILIGQDKAVKVTDFGIAGVLGQARISGIKMDIRNNTVGFSCQTVEGRGFGTPTHMPPEQFTNAASCDERSDIYSFGIVLYQMAAGSNLPFLPMLPVNDSPEEQSRFWWDIYKLHCNAPVPRLNSPLFPIIQRCLEKEPTKRYQSFAELRSEFEPLLKRRTGEIIKAPEQGKTEDWEWINKGVSLRNLGKYQEAIVCYDRAIAINPRQAEAWNNKGAVLGGYLGKHQEALICYNKAVKINPKYVEAWAGMGGVLGCLGKPQEAIDCYDRAIKIDPMSIEAWSNKGVALLMFGKYKEVITCCDKAIEIDPRGATAWGIKGAALSKLDKHQEAMACYDRMLEINPKDESAWCDKGFALVELGKYQEAIACFNKVLEINPCSAEAWGNKGMALADLGKYHEAIEAFENVIRFMPAHETGAVAEVKAIIQELKTKAEKKGNFQKVEEDFRRDAETWFNKGSALSKLDRHEEAIGCYDRALEINPKCAGAWGGKGGVLANIGKYHEAIDAFENFIKFAPAHDADKVAEVKAIIQKLSNLTLNVKKVRNIIGADIEAERRSFEQFIQMDKLPSDRKDFGLQSVFKSIFPIKNDSGTAMLDFVIYTLKEPEYSVEECQQKSMVYFSHITIVIRLIVWDKDERTGAQLIKDVKEQEMYFGVIPLMTENGTFIINGTERVFVSQFYPFAVDDIDYQTTGKSVCEVLENLYRIGLLRMVRTVKEKMNSCDIDTVLPYELINPQEVMLVVRKFFGQLSKINMEEVENSH